MLCLICKNIFYLINKKVTSGKIMQIKINNSIKTSKLLP